MLLSRPIMGDADQRCMRRRADKLKFIGWANLLVCMGVGVFADFGSAALRWSAAAAWSALLLVVCYARAAQMDREGPVKRRPHAKLGGER
jgi:hypothetical protein